MENTAENQETSSIRLADNFFKEVEESTPKAESEDQPELEIKINEEVERNPDTLDNVQNATETPINSTEKITEIQPKEDISNKVAHEMPSTANLKKVKETAAKLFSYIEKYPQAPINVGGTILENGRQIIRANQIGTICLSQTDSTKTSITVEYADSSRMKKKVFDNSNNFSLGDIAENAYVLASKGSEENIDEYENDEDQSSDFQKVPVVMFCLNTKDVGWSIEFPSKEIIENVALSSKYVYILNSNNLIRIYDYGKNEIFQFCLESSIVAMCAFEHFLAVFFLKGLPLYGTQSISARVYNIDKMSIEFEVPVCITPYKKLQWCGFSDEGILYCQDTNDCIRMLLNQQIWVPVFENEHRRKFWLLGVMDKELIGYRLSEKEPCPNPNYKYQIVTVSRKVQILNPFLQEEQEKLIRARIDNENDRITLQNYSFIKNTETNNPLRMIFKTKIKEPFEIEESFLQTETDKVDYIRKLLVDEKYDAAIYYALQIKTQNHFDVVIKILDQLKLKKVREDLKKLANEFGYFDMISSGIEKKTIQQECDLESRQTVQQNGKKENLKKFLEENLNEERNKNSFEDLKSLTTNVSIGNENSARNLNGSSTGFNGKLIIQEKQNSRSLMEELGRKNKSINAKFT